MTLESLSDVDSCFGWDGNQSGVADLRSVILELQGLTISITSGQVSANTNMPVTDIGTTDTILAAFELADPASSAASALINRTSVVSITSAGNVQSTAAMAAESQLLVFWMDKSG